MMLDEMARRARGTGTEARWIESQQRWRARITTGRDERGRQRQRDFYSRTPGLAGKAQAEQRRDEGLRLLDGGIILAGERVTVARFLRDWLEVRRPPVVRQTTWDRYRGIVEHNLVPALGHVPLTRLSPAAVERALVANELAPRTRHHMRAVLRTALARAVKHGLLTRNVAALADAPTVDEPERAVLDREQLRRFLDQVAGDRWEALYVVAVATGLRQGEVLGLRWQDLDLEAGTLRVVNQVQRRQLVPPKTKESRRLLGIGPAVVASLRAHQLRQEQQRRFIVRGDWGNEWGLVFTNSMGGPIHGPHVTRAFQAHLVAAGLPRLTFHALRHSAASAMLSFGIDEKIRQQVLGHGSAAMTTHYTHALPDALRRAGAAMDALVAR